MVRSSGIRGLGERVSELWADLIEERGSPKDAVEICETAIATAPIVWLLGKVQSGKTSIIRSITDCTEAEIGTGFRACTESARIFDFPAEAPIIRFLDTRGLGEVDYDPAEDLAFAESKAHLLVVVVRAMDQQLDDVLDVVKKVRERQRSWPIVVAQTTLHEAYATGAGHVLPYPFAKETPGKSGLPQDLVRSLARQRALFEKVSGRAHIAFVPIDFTQCLDGFDPPNYGLDALLGAIEETAPAGLAATLDQIHGHSAERLARQVHSRILGYAAVAAAADTVPLAGAVAAISVQARMLYAIGSQYQTSWDHRTLLEFAGCLGAGIVTRLLATFGIRQAVKLVPVYGQTAGSAAAAATSFATTYALGHAAVAFLKRRKKGTVDPAIVAAAYKEALASAFDMAKKRGLGKGRDEVTRNA